MTLGTAGLLCWAVFIGGELNAEFSRHPSPQPSQGRVIPEVMHARRSYITAGEQSENRFLVGSTVLVFGAAIGLDVIRRRNADV